MGGDSSGPSLNVVTWSEPTLKMMSGPDEVFDYLKNTKSFKDTLVTNRGNPDAALSQAQKKYEATSRLPFQLHGMIGPPCAVADVRLDKATIWTGTQGPFRTRDAIAKMLNVSPPKVSIFSTAKVPGSYGRLESDDVAEDAALMSSAVGKPVRVSLMHRFNTNPPWFIKPDILPQRFSGVYINAKEAC